MDLLKKTEILVDFIQSYLDDEEFEDFFIYNDLGVPMAVMYKNNLIIPTSEGENLLQETYSDLCDLFGANPDDDYENLNDLIG